LVVVAVTDQVDRVDTPRGLKPDGCSEHACGAPLRSPPTGLPGPKRRLTPAPGEHSSTTPLAPAERTVSRYGRAVPRATACARNPRQRLGGAGATRLPHPSGMRARKRRWTGRDGLKPAHASAHAWKGGGLRRA